MRAKNAKTGSSRETAAGVFSTHDIGNKGHLTRHEFKCAHLELFGTQPSKVH